MKNLMLFFMLIIILSTCSKSEEECTDAAGTVTVNIPNNNFFCFKTGSLAANCGFSTGLCCSDILFDPNNFAAASSIIGLDTSTPGFIKPIKGNSSIATSGKANKLCDIKAIPTSGFVNIMAADYNIGYVVKLADGTYAKFIVKGFGEFSTGGVSSVQITYQYPFQ
jgi:hypothetical protein